MADVRVITRPAPHASVATLYCFPHAGGAGGEYARWVAHTQGLRLAAVQPPGRAHDLKQSALTSMPELVSAILDQVEFTPPFALFGHSLGALVAFEVARALQPKPLRLFVSSCPAPPLLTKSSSLHLLDDTELHAEIEQRWGPLPAAATSDKELLTAALACYRADLQVLETYEYVPGPRLHSPVTAVVGDAEPNGAAWTEGWRDQTDGDFASSVRPGGHFHTRQDTEGLVGLLTDTVRSDLIRAVRDEPSDLTRAGRVMNC